MFGRRKQHTVPPYNKAGRVPVGCSSICTGEQTAGFKDPVSGKFEERMLIRSGKDLAEFLSLYQVDESAIQREWQQKHVIWENEKQNFFPPLYNITL